MEARTARDEVRERILDAADRLLAASGYKKMTVETLAREAGIGKGSIYLHFASKEELVLSHVDRIVDRLLAKLEAIAALDEPASERIRRMLVLRVVHRFDSVQHYSGSLSDLLAAIRPALLERRKLHFEREASLLSEVIASGVKAGELAADDPLAAAHTLVLATNALLPYSLSVQELGGRREIEQRVAAVADLLLHGLVRS